MTWNWRRESDACYRLDDTWTVQRGWVTHRWHAHKGNGACLVDHPDAGAAMEEAEKLREEDKLYAK